MKKKYLQKLFTLGLAGLLAGGINSQTTDTQRVWAKDANVLHDYYYWGASNKIQVMNSGANFTIPVENGVTEGVNYAWNNCFLKFENVDFGTLTESLTFVRNVPRGAIIEFWIDRDETTRYDDFFNAGGSDQSNPRNVTELSGGQFLGSYQHWYDKSGDWNRWETHQININKVGGVHDLYVVFRVGGKSETNQTVGGLYYIDLHRGIESGVTLSATDKNITLTIGEHKLDYTVTPASATSQLVWSVEAGQDVVAVNNGKVIAKKAGSAQVKCVLDTQTEVYDITVVGTATTEDFKIEAESADALYNTYLSSNGQTFEVKDLSGELLGSGMGLSYAWNTNFAVYENIDFGSFSDVLKFYHAEIRGAAVEFWIDRKIVDETNPQRLSDDFKNSSGKTLEGGTFLGRYEFLKNNNFDSSNTWKEFELSITPTSGVHDLYVVFLRGGKGTYEKTTGHYDWFQLSRTMANLYKITPSDTSIELSEGDDKTIFLTLEPTVVYNSDVTWTVEEGSTVVDVDNTGKITALSAGVAKVKVTSNADSNVFAEIAVKVNSTTAITETELSMTYENPISDNLQINSGSAIENILITDLAGRIVYQQNDLNNVEFKLNVSTWSAGLYFVQVKTATGQNVLKIIKQ